MTEVDIGERVLALRRRISEVSAQKAKIEGELESKKKSLAQLVKEIKAKGYNPQKLKSLREEKEQELVALCEETEAQLDEIELKLKDVRGD